VAHLALQRTDVDAVLQVPRSIGVAEFVNEPTHAEWDVIAAVGLGRAVLEGVGRRVRRWRRKAVMET
jgi:hypothetical protein